MGKKNGRVVWDNWEDWFFVVVFAAQHGVVEMFYKHMSIQSLTQLLSYCYLHDSLCTLTIGPRRNQLVFSWLTSNTFFLFKFIILMICCLCTFLCTLNAHLILTFQMPCHVIKSSCDLNCFQPHSFSIPLHNGRSHVGSWKLFERKVFVFVQIIHLKNV